MSYSGDGTGLEEWRLRNEVRRLKEGMGNLIDAWRAKSADYAGAYYSDCATQLEAVLAPRQQK